MKAVIVLNFFDPGYYYNEVVLAIGFLRLGWEVEVFASCKYSDESQRTIPPEFDSTRFKVHYLRGILRLGQSVLPLSADFYRRLSSNEADIIITIAPQRGLGVAALFVAPQKIPKVGIFADLYVNTSSTRLKRFVLEPVYRDVFKRCSILLGVAAETGELLKSMWGLEVDRKVPVHGLPFDEEVFSPVHKRALGPKLQEFVNGRRLLSTITMITEKKDMGSLFEQVSLFLEGNPDYCYLIAGIVESDYGRSLKERLLDLFPEGQVYFMGPLHSDEIAAVYRSSYLAIWFQASIGVQQSLACGTPCVLPREDYWSHVVAEGVNSVSFDNIVEVNESLRGATTIEWDRKQISDRMQKFSSVNSVREIVKLAGLS